MLGCALLAACARNSGAGGGLGGTGAAAGNAGGAGASGGGGGAGPTADAGAGARFAVVTDRYDNARSAANLQRDDPQHQQRRAGPLRPALLALDHRLRLRPAALRRRGSTSGAACSTTSSTSRPRTTGSTPLMPTRPTRPIQPTRPPTSALVAHARRRRWCWAPAGLQSGLHRHAQRGRHHLDAGDQPRRQQDLRRRQGARRSAPARAGPGDRRRRRRLAGVDRQTWR